MPSQRNGKNQKNPKCVFFINLSTLSILEEEEERVGNKNASAEGMMEAGSNIF
jgi:hypothetical protein